MNAGFISISIYNNGMEEYKLVVDFIFKTNSRNPFKKPMFPIQNRTFEVGVYIRNIGNNVFPGGTLKNSQITSAENKSTYESIDKEFSVPIINPGQNTSIWMGKMTTFLAGLVWVSGSIFPQNITTEKITTYQTERGTNEPVSPKNNVWGSSSFIKSGAEVESSYTNSLILLLTFLVFLETVFGLKNILIFIIHVIGYYFSVFGNFLTGYSR